MTEANVIDDREILPTIADVIHLLQRIPEELSSDHQPSESDLRILRAAASALSARAETIAGPEANAFIAVEKQIAAFASHPPTKAGFPRVRPEHCGDILRSLESIANTWGFLFRSGDELLASDFEAVIEAFSKTDVRAYPGEFQRVLLLLARIRMLRGDTDGVRDAIGGLAYRPYLNEAGFHPTLDIACLDLQARSAVGGLDDCSTKAIWIAAMLVRQEFGQAKYVGSRLASFIAIRDANGRKEALAMRLARRVAGAIASARRIQGRPATVRRAKRKIWIQERILGLLLLWIAFVSDDEAFRSDNKAKEIRADLVTRAMGGIGDLLMMTPGLRALSIKRGRPINLAVPRRFQAVFANNPHVELIDIEAEPLNPLDYRFWRNFTICPAGKYETKKAPNVKIGRVEIFARAMGLTPADLDRSGWNVEYVLTADNIKFRDDFIKSNGFGRRPIIGVQPYSRDAYKDHVDIAAIIANLAQDFDVILFHHRLDGLPEGNGIVNTAGLSLDKSISLVSALRAMVSVDSAFLHACSAFDVPVVALFGPTDGRTFTKHHRRVEVIAKRDRFPCIPCWRNEDLPCHVTGSVGVSPCIASITISDIRGALKRLDPSLPA